MYKSYTRLLKNKKNIIGPNQKSCSRPEMKITWTFECPTKFPMSLFAAIFRNMLGKQLNQGLQNLKALLEKK
jgi:hypothetical protein